MRNICYTLHSSDYSRCLMPRGIRLQIIVEEDTLRSNVLILEIGAADKSKSWVSREIFLLVHSVHCLVILM